MNRASANRMPLLSGALSIVIVAMIVVTVIMLARQPEFAFDPERLPYSRQASAHASTPQNELTRRFDQAVYMLHAKQYDHAVTALHRVIQLSPRMPEAYVNMGYALLGLERYHAAHDFFKTASDLDPYQANAYWGLAITFEHSGDLKAALGAMRIYIHLAKANDPFVRRARSALWEWETQLARGPLPENEKEFIDRGTRQWEERNLPRHDTATAQ